MTETGSILQPEQLYPEREARASYATLGLGLFILVIASQFGIVPLVYALELFAPRLLEATWMQYALSFLGIYGLGLPLLLLCIRKLPKSVPQPHRMKMSEVVLAFIICFGLMMVMNYFSIFIVGILEAISGFEIPSALDSTVTNAGFIETVIAVVIIAPIGEEFIFRKLICDRVGVYGEGAAILTGGIVFGLFHGNFYQVFYAFAIGAFLTYIYLRTGRLRYTVALHMAINFVGSVPGLLITRYIDEEAVVAATESGSIEALMEYLPQLLVLGVYGIAVISLTLAGIIMFFCFFKKMRQTVKPSGMPAGKRASITFGNVGMILFVCATALVFLFSVMSPIISSLIEEIPA